ncbi:MAG TPA: glycosyltransferase [Candidatus Dormibacteraeota bacterium]
MARILVVSHDLVRRRMAGPGIRHYELARRLCAAGHAVTLVAPGGTDIESDEMAIVDVDPQAVRRARDGHDLVLTQGWSLRDLPFLGDGTRPLVIDLYDPFQLEALVQMRGLALGERLSGNDACLAVLLEQLRRGDFFLCASEQQRDYWLGMLTAAGRLNPHTYDADPTLRRLVDVVPFGLPSGPPERHGPAARGVIPGIADGDLVVLWGGGLYDWLDPETLVRGVALAAPRLGRLRLVLHAARHPNSAVAEMSVAVATRRLSDDLGLTGRHVFFNEGWVPYEDRADWLLDADVGVSTHHPHIETRFAFRTRVLDYLWAGLPVLCTSGDALSEEVSRRGLGLTVPPGDPDAVAGALVALADAARRAEMSRRVREYAAGFTWERVAAPLLDYCAAPWRAADHEAVPPPEPAGVSAERDPGPLRRGAGRLSRRLGVRRGG